MERDYVREWSGALGREMELLRFGSSGQAVLVFPTSMGRFYQWEDFGMVEALADHIERGRLQLWCVDSLDGESWFAKDRSGDDRIRRHLAYERYLLDEILPRMAAPLAAGLSLGATHALLIAVRHPARFSGFLALSGAYDTARWLDGRHDGDAYYLNPVAFLPGLTDERYLDPLRAMDKRVIATGTEDPHAGESEEVARLLREHGVPVDLELWPGWCHDWPYWKEMIRRHV